MYVVKFISPREQLDVGGRSPGVPRSLLTRGCYSARPIPVPQVVEVFVPRPVHANYGMETGMLPKVPIPLQL